MRYTAAPRHVTTKSVVNIFIGKSFQLDLELEAIAISS
jgi:hypothetical protein